MVITPTTHYAKCSALSCKEPKGRQTPNNIQNRVRVKLGPCQAAEIILHVTLRSDSCAYELTKGAGNKTAFELFSQNRYLIISTFQAFEHYAFIKQKTTPTKYPSVAVKAVSMILFQPVNKAIWISSEGFGGFDSYKSHDVKQNFRSVPKHMQCDSRQWKLHNAFFGLTTSSGSARNQAQMWMGFSFTNPNESLTLELCHPTAGDAF